MAEDAATEQVSIDGVKERRDVGLVDPRDQHKASALRTARLPGSDQSAQFVV